eukprot:tig00000292_g23865.t1
METPATPAPSAEAPAPSNSSSSTAAYPWLLRTYARKKQQQPKAPAEMAADLDRCTRRAIASYAKRVEQYHPQMAEDARADSRYLGSLLTLGAVAYMSPARYYLVRILAAQFAGYYFVGPYLLNGLRKA